MNSENNSIMVCKTVASLREQLEEWRRQELKIGFVPTMGNLHDGHLSLVEQAQKHSDKVVVSIFVNPLQFGVNEDFDSYPRTFEQDQQQLQQVGADLLFFPAVDEIYPNGQEQTLVQVPKVLTELWEGAQRPGHFDGVTTIVSKLFNMVQPDLVVFGQKDYQQCAVIKRMVEDLAMPIEMLIAPIARDYDGLALSSRNQYLSSEQRSIAPQLYQQLLRSAEAVSQGEFDFQKLGQEAVKHLLATGFDQVDYFEFCDSSSLKPVEYYPDAFSETPISLSKEQKIVILAVARLGSTRLLDNYLL